MARPDVGTWIAAHTGLVWRVLRRSGVRAADCDDLCQEVFWTASQKARRIEPGKERAFLVAVALRKASDYRRSAYQRTFSLHSAPAQDEAAPLPEATDPTDDPEQLLDQKRARARLDSFLAALSPEFRDVFVLMEIEGWSTRETADALCVPTGTVSSRLSRARAQFHQAVEHYQLSHPPDDVPAPREEDPS